jgi:ketosteroid isomerase-like protein
MTDAAVTRTVTAVKESINMTITGHGHMSNEDTIRALIESWARAVSAGKRKAILAHHSPDLVMFDFPNEVRGLDAYDKTWDFFFANPRGKIVFEPAQIEVTAGADVAFAACLFHCDGTSAGALDFRLTTGLRRQGDEWVIVHEHHSVRTIEERFTSPATRQE